MEQETIIDHGNILTTRSNNTNSIGRQIGNRRVHV